MAAELEATDSENMAALWSARRLRRCVLFSDFLPPPVFGRQFDPVAGSPSLSLPGFCDANDVFRALRERRFFHVRGVEEFLRSGEALGNFQRAEDARSIDCRVLAGQDKNLMFSVT